MNFNPTGLESRLMLNSEAIYRYIHAGQGEVTLVSRKPVEPGSSEYKAHSYAFLEPKNKNQFPENTIFVYGLHDGHKMYLGMLDGSGFRRTNRSTFSDETEIVQGARYIIKMAARQDLVDKELMHLYHSGRCCYCGRPLSSDKSMKAGIGKKCLQRFNANLMKVPWDGNS